MGAFDPPAPTNDLWTNPASGAYSITLAPGITYTFNVDAWIPGYNASSRTVSPLTANRTENFALGVNGIACNAPGYRTIPFLTENFTPTTTPAGWTVIDNAGTGVVWRFDNPGARTNLTGGAGNWAIADSDNAGRLNMDTELRTPALNLSSASTARLLFKTDSRYFNLGPAEVADVDVSVNGAAGPWTNVWTRTADYRGPRTEVVDLTALAAGQSNVMIRSHQGNQSCTTLTVNRCYDITPTTPQTATIQFFYRAAEENSQTMPSVWHWNSVSRTWEGLVSTFGGSGEAKWSRAMVTSYSPFSLSDNRPTLVKLMSFGATSGRAVAMPLLLLECLLSLGAVVWARRRLG